MIQQFYFMMILLTSTRLPIDNSLMVNITLDIARGLDFLHTKGIAHRDIKALNVLVDINYKVYTIS